MEWIAIIDYIVDVRDLSEWRIRINCARKQIRWYVVLLVMEIETESFRISRAYTVFLDCKKHCITMKIKIDTMYLIHDGVNSKERSMI